MNYDDEGYAPVGWVPVSEVLTRARARLEWAIAAHHGSRCTSGTVGTRIRP